MSCKWLLVSTLLWTAFSSQLASAQDKEVPKASKTVLEKTVEKSVEETTDGKKSVVNGLEIIGKFDESLAESVSSYWNSFISGDMIKCYQLHCKDYKSDVSIVDFVKMENIAISEITVIKLNQTKENVLVKFEGKASHESFIFKKLPLKQRWIKESDKWVIFKISEKGKKILPF